MSFDRKQLDFNGKVRKEFSFLTSEFDFRIVEEQITFVRYESADVFVNFYHGRRSCELGVEMGLMGDRDADVPLGIILEVVAPEFQEPASFQAVDAKVIENCLAKFSNMLKKYCHAVLRGDPIVWKGIFQQLEMEKDRFIVKYSIDPIKEMAEVAWKNKEYSEVVRLLSPIYQHLSKTEVQKFEYAKKKLSQ